MVLGDRGNRWCCLLVWASGTSALAGWVMLLLPGADRLWSSRAALGALPLDVALVDAAAVVLVGCGTWAWVALSVTVVDAWRGVTREPRGPWRLPPGVRRAVLAACGVALASAVTVPAHAGSSGPSRHRHGIARLGGLPLPDRAEAPRRRHGRADQEAPGIVVVAAGDSLWSIARRDLGPGASDLAVVSHWHAIYAANRRLIGPDPDLVRPGQRLLLPRKDR